MTRTPAAALIASFVFVAALLLAAAAVRSGLMTDDAMRLWAGASTAGGGDVPIGRIVAAYPTIPFLSTTLITLLAPDGAPAPALVAAGLLALIAGFWFVSFRDLGLPALAAALATFLVAFHPLLLRAALAGPADAFLAVFLFMLGGALYDLRARSTSPEVMAVGLALFLLVFSHPIGAAIAFAAVPFLVFAVRPVLVASSALNVVVALVFPTVFAIAAFVYVAWVFPGAGWSFLAAPTESLSAWSAGMARVFGDGLTGSLAADASLTIGAALVLGAPIALTALIWVRRRRVLVTPALVFAATIITAGAIAVATGLFGDPTAITVAAPVLAAVVMTRVPAVREHLAFVLPLLALGWAGGALSLALIDPSTGTYLHSALNGRGGDRERIDALAAGGATIGRDGVLADTDNAPAFVVGRGRARGIFDPSSQAFALAKLFSRIETPFVAVPDPHSNTGVNDRLNKAFPTLFRGGASGYRVVYQNDTWRIFGRVKDVAAKND